MAMQLAAPVVTRQPGLDKGGATLGIPRLVIAMGAGMRGVGVPRVERERALDLARAGADIAQLDPRPAETGQKPPILVPPRRPASEQRQPRLVEINPPAEPQHPADPELPG